MTSVPLAAHLRGFACYSCRDLAGFMPDEELRRLYHQLQDAADSVEVLERAIETALEDAARA